MNRYSSAIKRYHRSKGHGIHSPFAFHFVTRVLRERTPFYAYADIQNFMELVKREVSLKRRRHLGAALISNKCAKIIFRLVNYFQPSNILQISGNYGIITSSVIQASSAVNIFTYERTFSKYELAGYLRKKFAFQNKISQGSSLKSLIEEYQQSELDSNNHFVIVNNLSTVAEYQLIIQLLKETVKGEGIIVMRNLHRHSLCRELWGEVIERLTYGMTFTNGKMGIIVLNSKLPHQNFNLWF